MTDEIWRELKERRNPNFDKALGKSMKMTSCEYRKGGYP